MSQWRRKAIEFVPSCKEMIENPDFVWSQMSLWIELMRELETSYKTESSDKSVKDEIWKYFHYALSQYKDERLMQAVYCGFVEHLLLADEISADINARIERSTYLSLKEPFTYHASEERFIEILSTFSPRKKRKK